MSRTRIIALFAALFALATGIAACGGGGGGSGSEADVEEVFANATLQGIESGKFAVALDVSSKGDSAGDVSVTLSGAFQKQAGQDLPQLEMDLAAEGKAEGEDVDFKGGLTLLSDRAFVDFQGTEYEVDPTTFGFVKSRFEQEQQAAPEEAEGEGSKACQEAVEGLELNGFIENAENEGSAEVDGQETTKISGDLDVAGAVEAMIGLSEDPGCESQLQGAGPLPLDELEAAKDEVAAAVKKAHAEVYVGEDGIIRRIAAQLVVEPSGQGRVDVDLDLTLSEVNEDQEIGAPANAEPLEGLFRELGVNPLELLEGGGSGGITGLLEGLLDGAGTGSGSGSGSGGSGSGSGGGSGSSGGSDLEQQQAYFECLQEVQTAEDLQKCASLAP